MEAFAIYQTAILKHPASFYRVDNRHNRCNKIMAAWQGRKHLICQERAKLLDFIKLCMPFQRMVRAFSLEILKQDAKMRQLLKQ